MLPILCKMGLFSFDIGRGNYPPLLIGALFCVYSCTVDSNRQSGDNLFISFQIESEPLLNYVSSASLSVISNGEITVFDTSFALDLTSGDPPRFDIQVPEPNNLTVRAWFFDQPRRPLYRVFRVVNITDNSAPIVILNMAQSGFLSGTHVKILRDEPPWDSFGLDTALTETGFTLGSAVNQFDVCPSLLLPAVDLYPDIDLLVISNDQPQGFYDNLAINLGKILDFVSGGGTVFWEACDLAWNYGSFAAAGMDSFPGGIAPRTAYDQINIIADQNLLMVQGLADTLRGTYASNKFLANVPDSVIIYTENSGGNPTLIGMRYGDGIIIYSGQPLEYNYDRRYENNIGFLLPRVMHFLLGLQWEGSLLLSFDGVSSARPESAGDI